MPIECTLLKDAPNPLAICPKCRQPFRPFLRGLIQRSERKWRLFGPRRPYCALICWACKEIVGYEDPAAPEQYELI